MRPNESFVGQPVRSLQTMLRLLAEDDPALPTVVPDGIYGPTTMLAVTAFQRRQGLPVTGVTDVLTWEHVVQAYEPAKIRRGKAESIEILLAPGEIITIGQYSPYVYLLQGMLAFLSAEYDLISLPDLSGVLDTRTADAIRSFQAISDLPQTGTLDAVTWKHLVRQFTLQAGRQHTQ